MSHYRWFWTIVSSDFIVRNDRARKSFNIVSNKAKGRISKRVFQENKARHTYISVSGGKKCLFFGKFGVLCFLETPVLRFALLPYYQRKLIQDQPKFRKINSFWRLSNFLMNNYICPALKKKYSFFHFTSCTSFN